jgi:hypothetical protein
MGLNGSQRVPTDSVGFQRVPHRSMFSVPRFFLLKNDKNTVENHLFYNIKRSAMLRGEYNIHNRSEHVSLENKAKNFNSLCGGGQQNGRPSRTPPPPVTTRFGDSQAETRQNEAPSATEWGRRGEKLPFFK